MGSGNFPKLNARQKAAGSTRSAFRKEEEAAPAASTKVDRIEELNRQHEERMARRAAARHTQLDEEQEKRKKKGTP